MTLRLTTKTHKTLKLIATAQGRSVNDIITELVEGWMPEQPEYKQMAKIADNADDAGLTKK